MKVPTNETNIVRLISSADLARDSRRWSEAEVLYRTALDVNDALAPIWVQYGHALKEQKKLQQAEGAYSRAIEIDSTNADTHLQMGHLRKVQGNLTDAAAWYKKSLELNPNLEDARRELVALNWSPRRLQHFIKRQSKAITSAGHDFADIAFELSDIVDYLQNARYPTGIQRVQISIAEAFLELFGQNLQAENRLKFVYFDHGRYSWVQLYPSDIEALLDLIQDNNSSDDVRRTRAEQLKAAILSRVDYEFPIGCFLVNLGTSWGYWNYFLALRDAKQRGLIKYVPMIHDCIPIIYPEFCSPRLVKDFINWVVGMLKHADLILANSNNTKADLYKIADKLGILAPECTAIHLNAKFGAMSNVASPAEGSDVLKKHRLDLEDFVLLVSTIEPRKNHGLVLSAWSRMLKSGQAVPRLVCVGNSGWQNEEFYQRLGTNDLLRERVVVLTNVSEDILRSLYQRCIFTIFPSLYEGWGLPISEALSHGKVPLVSKISSHAEAGGDLAVYFDLGSEADFFSKLQTLLYDKGFRQEHEKKISSSTFLRPWQEISEQIIQVIDHWLDRHRDKDGHAVELFRSPAPIKCGIYYSFGRNCSRVLSQIRYSGEIYRNGMGWHAPEEWGCSINGGAADLAFDLSEEPGAEFALYLHLSGAPGWDRDVTIFSSAPRAHKRIKIPHDGERWVKLPLRVDPTSSKEVRIRISSSDQPEDSRRIPIGVKGIYVCKADDLDRRLAITEAILIGEFDQIAYQFSPASTSM